MTFLAGSIMLTPSSLFPSIHRNPLKIGFRKSMPVASPTADKAMGAIPSWWTEYTGYLPITRPDTES
jgi:hypothetical protein